PPLDPGRDIPGPGRASGNGAPGHVRGWGWALAGPRHRPAHTPPHNRQSRLIRTENPVESVGRSPAINAGWRTTRPSSRDHRLRVGAELVGGERRLSLDGHPTVLARHSDLEVDTRLLVGLVNARDAAVRSQPVTRPHLLAELHLEPADVRRSEDVGAVGGEQPGL